MTFWVRWRELQNCRWIMKFSNCKILNWLAKFMNNKFNLPTIYWWKIRTRTGIPRLIRLQRTTQNPTHTNLGPFSMSRVARLHKAIVKNSLIKLKNLRWKIRQCNKTNRIKRTRTSQRSNRLLRWNWQLKRYSKAPRRRGRRDPTKIRNESCPIES